MEETDGQGGVSWHWAVLTWGWGVIGREKLFCPFQCILELPWWLKWLRLCLKCRRPGFYLCQEGPLEKGMATHSSILAWRNLWTARDWWATVHDGKELDRTEWLSFSFQCICLFVFFSWTVLELPHWIPGLYTKILLSVNYCKNWWHVRGWQNKILILPYCWLMTKLVWQKILQ